ncbi:MAG: DNA-binding protein WhiA [Lachnospiraceae bacterium]|nr:DNA-binding protein WhiA [Lachnospiraceae bacterium]
MSFSSDVKKELVRLMPEKEHCVRAELAAFLEPEKALDDPELVRRPCCKKAYLRGLFLKCGSISDPEKIYHLEFACESRAFALRLKEFLTAYELRGKIVERKGHYVVYLKDSSQIADFLALVQASTSLFSLENTMVVKDVRNTVNRKVNCETANIRKTVSASLSQIEAIEYIRDHIGIEKLPAGLQETARLRIENPDDSLTQLGEKMNPPIGKSGVNHRLRKLRRFAEEEML